MPIRQHLGDNRAFDPDDLKAMGEAFSAALNKLGLHAPFTIEILVMRVIRRAFVRRQCDPNDRFAMASNKRLPFGASATTGPDSPGIDDKKLAAARDPG